MASARVGLGSAKLDLGREWTGGRHITEEDDAPGRRAGLVDRVSGLPSPPGTESDVALPNVNGESSLMSEVSDPDTGDVANIHSPLHHPSNRHRHSTISNVHIPSRPPVLDPIQLVPHP